MEPTTVARLEDAPRPLRRAALAVAITGIAQFMAALDNLVVTTALPVMREHLHAGLSGLEWTVNAYTLTFAVLLLSGAALGDRFGRRRMFVAGLALFTTASAAAALAPGIGVLIAARAVQGAGGALLVPLSLTLLSAAVPPERRNAALGVWGALGGLAVAVGPLVGGAVVQGLSWQFIFWLNVPVGLLLIPSARFGLAESSGRPSRLDLAGVALASIGLFGIVFALVRGGSVGWTSASVLAGFTGGAALLAGFLARERRAAAPMLALGLFRSRQFSLINIVALLMSFGMFGSIFLLAQFFQTVQHYSPLAAGVRTLPWTGMPVLVAPIAGMLVDRIGGKTLVVTGLLAQAAGLGLVASHLSPTMPYIDAVPGFLLAGVGMALFFVPVASLVLTSVRRDDEGMASGTNNAVRELGGVLGVSVLAAIFAGTGGYGSGASFVAGLTPAVWVGVAVVAAGGVAAMALPGRRRRAQLAPSAELAAEAA